LYSDSLRIEPSDPPRIKSSLEVAPSDHPKALRLGAPSITILDQMFAEESYLSNMLVVNVGLSEAEL
jgi:hypothetical protein